MCYRNGYGHRCECCGMEKTKKELTAEEKSMVRAILHFLDIWGDMIEAVKYDENGMEPFMVAFTPGEQMKVIPKDKAEEYLPCFGEDDVIELARTRILSSAMTGSSFSRSVTRNIWMAPR